jgi:RNA polymerase sigma-70 factor (ECF subfamily)
VRGDRALSGEIARALERMPENQRVVFLLKIDQGLTYERISEILRCPTGTAKSRFHFAVMRLRTELRDWADHGTSTGGNGSVMR